MTTTVMTLLPYWRRKRIAAVVAALTLILLPSSASVASILLGIWIVAALFATESRDIKPAITHPAALSGVVLLAWMMISILWSPAPAIVWADELESYVKLLAIPIAFAALTNERAIRLVLAAFLTSLVLTLALSWLTHVVPIVIPGVMRLRGIVLDDHSVQSVLFVLAAFALSHLSITLWSRNRTVWARPAAFGLALLVCLFLANIAFVATARATLIVAAALVLLFCFQRFGLKGMLAGMVLGGLLGGVLWTSSPYLRERVLNVEAEISGFLDERLITSSGVRIELWTKGRDIVSERPIFGHGAGSTMGLYRDLATDTEPTVTDDTHNQVLQVAIPYGAIGVVLLLAMWVSHFWLFAGQGLYSWVGQALVVQNVITGIFNSHIWVFTLGWYYALGIALLGAAVLAQRRSRTDLLSRPGG